MECVVSKVKVKIIFESLLARNICQFTQHKRTLGGEEYCSFETKKRGKELLLWHQGK